MGTIQVSDTFSLLKDKCRACNYYTFYDQFPPDRRKKFWGKTTNDNFSTALCSHIAVNRHRQLQDSGKTQLLCQIYLRMWLALAGWTQGSSNHFSQMLLQVKQNKTDTGDWLLGFIIFLFSYDAKKDLLWMYVSSMELPTGGFLRDRKWSSCKFIHIFLADARGLDKIRWQTTVAEINLPHIPINTANTSVPKLSNMHSFWKKW